MSIRDINGENNTLSFDRIETSDTLTQFMEKINNNFASIIEYGAGPIGEKGDRGDIGIPTKPKVPIHVWIEGEDYSNEIPTSDGGYEIEECKEDLSDAKYQEGHLIMLKNAHVYILETNDTSLKPKFVVALQTYDPTSIPEGSMDVDVINPNTITSESQFVEKLFDPSINGEKLIVTSENIKGTLSVGGENDNINVVDIVNAVNNGSTTISGDKIDVSNLSVSKLNTNPTEAENTSSVKIEDNKISILDSTKQTVCEFSDEPIPSDININNAFKQTIIGNGENCKTHIYKDGILIRSENRKNGINGMLICNEGILLKFKNYGIKIDEGGIKYSTNLSTIEEEEWNAIGE